LLLVDRFIGQSARDGRAPLGLTDPSVAGLHEMRAAAAFALTTGRWIAHAPRDVGIPRESADALAAR
jgi:hypothetical protein